MDKYNSPSRPLGQAALPFLIPLTLPWLFLWLFLSISSCGSFDHNPLLFLYGLTVLLGIYLFLTLLFTFLLMLYVMLVLSSNRFLGAYYHFLFSVILWIYFPFLGTFLQYSVCACNVCLSSICSVLVFLLSHLVFNCFLYIPFFYFLLSVYLYCFASCFAVFYFFFYLPFVFSYSSLISSCNLLFCCRYFPHTSFLSINLFLHCFISTVIQGRSMSPLFHFFLINVLFSVISRLLHHSVFLFL